MCRKSWIISAMPRQTFCKLTFCWMEELSGSSVTKCLEEWNADLLITSITLTKIVSNQLINVHVQTACNMTDLGAIFNRCVVIY